MSDRPAPSNRAALRAWLEDAGVQPSAYNLNGAHQPDSIVLDHRAAGWVVFYTERGAELQLAVHPDEASACADLLDRVTADEHVFFTMVVGPRPAAVADQAFARWLGERGADRASLDPGDYKCDDVPWLNGPARRYFVRTTAIRRLES